MIPTSGKYFYIQCTRVSPGDYDDCCTLNEFNWSCLLCLLDVLPPDNACDLNIDSGLTVCYFDDALLSPEGHFSGSFTASSCVFHHNAQGLLSKFTDTTQWLHSCHGSNVIVCSSETWL